jgi:FKBP-type peptidyl-prolyl cis-trans isomerase
MKLFVWPLWLVLAALPAPAMAQGYGISQNENLRFLDDAAKRPGMVKLPDGVMYRVIASGTGEAPASRLDKVTVTYSGFLINNKRFDYSRPGRPAMFFISRLIPGWAEVLMKMREGDRWEVIIPADLAYGDGSSGAVPPGQTLRFLLQLDHVEHQS